MRAMPRQWLPDTAARRTRIRVQARRAARVRPRCPRRHEAGALAPLFPSMSPRFSAFDIRPCDASSSRDASALKLRDSNTPITAQPVFVRPGCTFFFMLNSTRLAPVRKSAHKAKDYPHIVCQKQSLDDLPQGLDARAREYGARRVPGAGRHYVHHTARQASGAGGHRDDRFRGSLCAPRVHVAELSTRAFVADDVHRRADDLDAQLSRFGNGGLVCKWSGAYPMGAPGSRVLIAAGAADCAAFTRSFAMGREPIGRAASDNGQPRRRFGDRSGCLSRIQSRRARLLRGGGVGLGKYRRQRFRELEPASEARCDGRAPRLPGNRCQRRPLSGASQRAAL